MHPSAQPKCPRRTQEAITECSATATETKGWMAQVASIHWLHKGTKDQLVFPPNYSDIQGVMVLGEFCQVNLTYRN